MHARAIKKHREYEIVYLLAPSTTPGRAEKVGDSVREVLQEAQGKLLKVNLWGIRALAFKIKGHRQGIYYYTRFIATQGAVDEIERRLKLADSVLRYLTVRLSKHEVDPAEFTVKEEEASFKGIEDLHASLQERSAPAAEVKTETAPAASSAEPKAEVVDEKKPAPAKEPKAEVVAEKKKDEAKASGDDTPKVEAAPAKEPEKAEDKAAETEEKS